MYQAFYRLKADPFRLSPDHAFCYRYPSFSKGRAYMQYALNAAEGFVVITGRPGMGKTTLINDLLADFGPEDYLVATLVNTLLEANDLLRTVAYEFGLDIEGVDKATVLQRLKQLFVRSRRSARPPLLVVDEAQNLSLQALEELRLLTNLQLNGKPLLQIFLVGQENLRDKLADPRLEQLRQRITAAAHLEPLTEAQTAAYIVHRLRVVGWNEFPRIKSSVLPIIQATCEGIPRRINQFCGRLLLHGSVEEKDLLDAEDARVVVAELGDERLTSTAGAASATTPEMPAKERAGALGQGEEASILDAAAPLLEQQRPARHLPPSLAPPGGAASPSSDRSPPSAAVRLVRSPTRQGRQRELGPDSTPDPQASGASSHRKPLVIPVVLILLVLGSTLFAVSRFGAPAWLARGSLLGLPLFEATAEPPNLAMATAEQTIDPAVDTRRPPVGALGRVGGTLQPPASAPEASTASATPRETGVGTQPVDTLDAGTVAPVVPTRPPTPAAAGTGIRGEETTRGEEIGIATSTSAISQEWAGAASDGRDDEISAAGRPAPGKPTASEERQRSDVAELRMPIPSGAIAPPPRVVLREPLLETRQVSFGFDSAEIQASERPRLDSLAEELQRDTAQVVRIVGYADSVGPRAYNERLARRRAEAVAEYLTVQGVSPQRLSVDRSQVVSAPPTAEDSAGEYRRVVEIYVEASN